MKACTSSPSPDIATLHRPITDTIRWNSTRNRTPVYTPTQEYFYQKKVLRRSVAAAIRASRMASSAKSRKAPASSGGIDPKSSTKRSRGPDMTLVNRNRYKRGKKGVKSGCGFSQLFLRCGLVAKMPLQKGSFFSLARSFGSICFTQR